MLRLVPPPVCLTCCKAAITRRARIRQPRVQVIVCGDLNVAASQQDVHPGLDYSRMYSAEEKRLLAGLLEALHDAWRSQHPDTSNVFTVWDEYTNARVFNRVRGPLPACQAASTDQHCWLTSRAVLPPGPAVHSQHLPQPPASPRGRGPHATWTCAQAAA